MKGLKKVLAVSMAFAMAAPVAQIGSLGTIEAQAASDISRVSVHDPSIFEDNGEYYVFGSHIATAKSTDLVNWTQVSTDYQDVENNVIYGSLKENLAESFEWAGYDDGDCAGGNYAVWAPDVIYNKDYEWEDGSKGAYMLYYSASSTWRRSCIGYMVSKTVDGGYQYGGTVVYSGFTNTGKVNYDGNSTRDTTWTNDYLPFNDLIAEGKIDGDASTWKCFNKDGSWNNNYAPNAIDPTLFYDETGEHLYMVYGSWSGGLFILEIDKTTGEAIYPGEDGVEATSGNYVDRYFGTHIAGGNHQSGEGPYIVYDKNTDYYYLYETYGGLTTTGGYNMRQFRSKNVYGPYVDAAGNEAGNSGVNCYKYGVKLIGNYQFYNQPGYRAAGHNSAMVTEDGDYYLVYHQRFLDSSRGEGHEVRVRQQFLNEDDWLVTAVYENRNEQIQKYTEDEVVGNYEFVNHGNAEKDGSMITTQSVQLNADGTVTGDETGSWTMADAEDYTYVTIDIDGATYKGVFFKQTNDNGEKVMTFTAIGNNNLAIWGSKLSLSDDVVVEKAAEQLKSDLPDATREDITLPTSLSGASIKWTSSDESAISTDGKVTSKNDDVIVTLTAEISAGSLTKTYDFEVVVYDTPKVIVEYDFDSVDGDNVTATSASKLSTSATLKGSASVVEDETRGSVLKLENAAGNKQVNYLLLPDNCFSDVDKSGYTVSLWANVDSSTWEHSALFEADWLADGASVGTYPMTRIGANLIGRINANAYSDAVPSISYSSLTGNWNLITYTVSPNGIKVFLNGEEIVYDKKDISSCFTGEGAAIQNVNHVMVGAGDIWTDEDVRNAMFDDVAIFDTPMTNAEVKAYYEASVKDKDDDDKDAEETEKKLIDDEPELEENQVRAYYQLDESWSEAYIYASYKDAEGNVVEELVGEMPGQKMSHIGNNWYSMVLPKEIFEDEPEAIDEAVDEDAEAIEADVVQTESEETKTIVEKILDEIKSIIGGDDENDESDEIESDDTEEETEEVTPSVARHEVFTVGADGTTLELVISDNGKHEAIIGGKDLVSLTRPTDEELGKNSDEDTEDDSDVTPSNPDSSSSTSSSGSSNSSSSGSSSSSATTQANTASSTDSNNTVISDSNTSVATTQVASTDTNKSSNKSSAKSKSKNATTADEDSDSTDTADDADATVDASAESKADNEVDEKTIAEEETPTAAEEVVTDDSHAPIIPIVGVIVVAAAIGVTVYLRKRA